MPGTPAARVVPEEQRAFSSLRVDRHAKWTEFPVARNSRHGLCPSAPIAVRWTSLIPNASNRISSWISNSANVRTGLTSIPETPGGSSTSAITASRES
jgi:hypothetical protein